MQIRMLRLSEGMFILFFNKFHLILFCFCVAKMKKIVTKDVACFSNDQCFKG